MDVKGLLKHYPVDLWISSVGDNYSKYVKVKFTNAIRRFKT